MIEIMSGDNATIMRELRERGSSFALAYLDPPFFSGAEYRTADGEPAFDDRWPSRAEYMARLREWVSAARDLLIPEGCLVLHLDPSASHYAKVMCDEVFGEQCFASEIIWRYRRWPAKTPNFQAMHDVLLRYVRDDRAIPRWNQLYEPLSDVTLEKWKGRRQKSSYVNGRRVTVREKTDGPTSIESSNGAPLSDVWDLKILAQCHPERTGYPTQKPEALIARLIDACTNEGDWVLDPFMGSGTTLAVCAKRGRNAVGIDASPVALRYAEERLRPILAQRSLFAEVGS